MALIGVELPPAAWTTVSAPCSRRRFCCSTTGAAAQWPSVARSRTRCQQRSSRRRRSRAPPPTACAPPRRCRPGTSAGTLRRLAGIGNAMTTSTPTDRRRRSMSEGAPVVATNPLDDEQAASSAAIKTTLYQRSLRATLRHGCQGRSNSGSPGGWVAGAAEPKAVGRGGPSPGRAAEGGLCLSRSTVAHTRRATARSYWARSRSPFASARSAWRSAKPALTVRTATTRLRATCTRSRAACVRSLGPESHATGNPMRPIFPLVWAPVMRDRVRWFVTNSAGREHRASSDRRRPFFLSSASALRRTHKPPFWRHGSVV